MFTAKGVAPTRRSPRKAIAPTSDGTKKKKSWQAQLCTQIKLERRAIAQERNASTTEATIEGQPAGIRSALDTMGMAKPLDPSEALRDYRWPCCAKWRPAFANRPRSLCSLP